MRPAENNQNCSNQNWYDLNCPPPGRSLNSQSSQSTQSVQPQSSTSTQSHTSSVTNNPPLVRTGGEFNIVNFIGFVFLFLIIVYFVRKSIYLK